MDESKIIKVGEIKKAIRTNEERRFRYLNEKYEGSWDDYDNFYVFGMYFLNTLPKHYQDIESHREKEDPKRYLGFIKYIEDILKGSDLTAVEFGGPGSSLFSNFSPGFFVKTIGVCLEDIRNDIILGEDATRNHIVVPGNILDINRMEKNDLLDRVKKELGRDKTNLIISRMGGPVGTINKNPAILDRIIRNWYSMLADNGLMFIQFAHETETSYAYLQGIKRWASVIQERFPEIEIQIEWKVMRLHKRAGSPEELPPATKLF